MFRVGQKVVCVDAGTTMISGLVKGEIYTIEGFCHGVFDTGIFLEELHVSNPPNVYRWAYNINRFRPLDHQFAEDLCEKLIKETLIESI